MSGTRAEETATAERIAVVEELCSDAVVTFDPTGQIVGWNPAAERLFGYTAEEAIGRNGAILIPDDRAVELPTILGMLARGESVDRLETKRRHRNGRDIPVLVSTRPLTDPSGEVVGGCAVVKDLTEQVTAQSRRLAAEARFEAAFMQSSFGMIIADLDALPRIVNPAMCDMLGRPEHELVGRRWDDLYHPDDVVHYDDVLDKTRSGADVYRNEWRYLRPDGSVLWVQIHSTLVRNVAGSPMYYMTQLQDITESKRLETELERRALHDELTGLSNRALLNDRLDQALAVSKRDGTRVGVVFIDIDNFKRVNDTLGHTVGDRVLVEVGHRLRRGIRPGDTSARFGGDEFVVVCQDVEVDSMEKLSARIYAALDEPLTIDAFMVPTHVSLGMTLSRPDSTSQSLLSEADAAMYRAKDKGRGQAVFFEDSLREQASALFEGERSLLAGVAGGEMVAYYQPIVDMSTGRPAGFEALVRWHTSDGRIVMPSDFIALAESTGVIVSLGQAILEQAVEAAVRWNEPVVESPPIWVSVNLSPRQLVDSHLVELVASLLSSSRLPPSLLHLEITESAVMEDLAQAVDVLHALKALGVRLAVDDFGTGYSSLAYMRHLPVDTLKVDRAFVAGLGANSSDTSIVKAIVTLADSLELECVAEGVETPEQQSVLNDLGCGLGQGYLWSRPMPPDETAAWLAAQRR